MNPMPTLLRREWMQHHKGYLAMMIVPPVVALVVLALARHIEADNPYPEAVMALAIWVVSGAVMLLGWLAMAFQMPGLARRDQQDRSIEFWLSLPVSHSQSLGATLLFHALLMPWLALAIGWLFSFVIGLVLVAMLNGAGAWGQLPWGLLMMDSVVLLGRLFFGIALATLWLSPLLLLAMLAGSALKRWGLPALAAALGLASLILHQVYGVTIVRDSMRHLAVHAAAAVSPIIDKQLLVGRRTGEGFIELLHQFPGIAGDSAVRALQSLATPQFAAAMTFSALCFAGLVALRRRNA
jgi:hypothetical protein